MSRVTQPPLPVRPPKRILVVAHDPGLRNTRVSLLENANYAVTTAISDDDALKLLNRRNFDLVLIGRSASLPVRPLDQRINEKYPILPLLKIDTLDAEISPYATRTIIAHPGHLLLAVQEMLA